MSEAVVVIGAGQAAAQLGLSLRQGKFAGPIVVFGDEPYPPYQRPPLSKTFLAERPAPDHVFLRPASFWHEQGVTLELGVPVAAVDCSRRCVTLADGREVAYGHLVFATGTRARTLPLPGLDLPGVFSVRQIADVVQLRPALDKAQRIVIVGGGYIGLEVTYVMRKEGREAIVLEAEDRVMKRVAGETVSAFFQTFHRDHGVDIRLGARLVAIEGNGQVDGVRLASGERLPADLVLAATGARANDELAVAAGLACEDGILVDELARTAAPDVFAIGDCTRFPSGRYGRRIRLECVQNAIDQAKAVAGAILGDPKPYDPVPWFWSDQHDAKLQIAGLIDGHDTATVVGDPAAAKFSVEYRKNGKLIAVEAVNDGRAYMAGRRRIGEETAATV